LNGRSQRVCQRLPEPCEAQPELHLPHSEPSTGDRSSYICPPTLLPAGSTASHPVTSRTWSNSAKDRRSRIRRPGDATASVHLARERVVSSRHGTPAGAFNRTVPVTKAVRDRDMVVRDRDMVVRDRDMVVRDRDMVVRDRGMVVRDRGVVVRDTWQPAPPKRAVDGQKRKGSGMASKKSPLRALEGSDFRLPRPVHGISGEAVDVARLAATYWAARRDRRTGQVIEGKAAWSIAGCAWSTRVLCAEPDAERLACRGEAWWHARLSRQQAPG
jgi:hypothetical protein